ncbi:carboxylate-amine ligase [Lentzea nigeriaca]|uniref:carboxylate-amine ligase n=1 Tax=Lentzea nigeriaca TaxID=1128665 RepID=UPI001EF7EE56|nr:glutamate--cysteine ligase [Lentzea nigeriaca]
MLGVEEEFLLVDPRTGEPVPRALEVARWAREQFGVEFDLELTAAQLEAKTTACHDLAEVRRQLLGARFIAAESARQLGCLLLAVAVPPIGASRMQITADDRYRQIADDYGRLAVEQLICGCHVHVSVPDRETAVQVCNHVRLWLPVLGMVTANSPFAHGRDTGYASWRSMVWSRWPVSGPPPWFSSAQHYDEVCDSLVATGAARDLKMIYWDVRPSSHLPTVEVRVADVAATVDEAVLLAALVRALVATAVCDVRRGVAASNVPVELLRLAAWKAARDGLSGQAFDVMSGQLLPARLLLDRLVSRVRDQLVAIGDLGVVLRVLSVVDRCGDGATRQRKAFSVARSLHNVVDQLAEELMGEPTGDPGAMFRTTKGLRHEVGGHPQSAG